MGREAVPEAVACAGGEMAIGVIRELRRSGIRVPADVLAENARARRFYERSGFRLQGRTHELHQLGGLPKSATSAT
jgi:RimJ/RimL family protein N-acetyltransferase